MFKIFKKILFQRAPPVAASDQQVLPCAIMIQFLIICSGSKKQGRKNDVMFCVQPLERKYITRSTSPSQTLNALDSQAGNKYFNVIDQSKTYHQFHIEFHITT